MRLHCGCRGARSRQQLYDTFLAQERNLWQSRVSNRQLRKTRMEIMKTKIAIVGVVAALMPNLVSYAGESMAGSSAATQNQSASGNQQSSQATTQTSSASSSSSSGSSAATTRSTSSATTSNPNARGRVVSRTPAPVAAARRGENEPKLYRARVRTAAKTYYPGFKRSGYAKKTSSTHWQTKTWN